MTSPSNPGIASTGFAAGKAGRIFAGKAMSFVVQKDLLPITDTGADPRRLEENFRRIAERLKPYEGGTPELYQVAKFFGGAYVTGTVSAASGLTGDTHFTHELARIPKWIMLAVDLSGLGGTVSGIPAGGLGATGGNQSPWTKTDIFVRATVTSQYAFIVL